MTKLKTIEIGKALSLDDTVFVDVRSPLEYEEDRIVGAINIPLLDDEERKIIGTLYKQEGKDIAIEEGLRFTSNKIDDFYIQFRNLSREYENIVIYCARGGMRSASMVNFFSPLGMNLIQLEGGYKSYRNHVLRFWENIHEKCELIVLHGLTGVGKTEALYSLQEKGISTLDLEGLAKNSGSVFGHVYFKENPPSQKYFESLLFNEIKNSKSKYLFIESESKRIGGVCLPNDIYDKMTKEGYHILLKSNMENRIKRLVHQYVRFNDKEDGIIIDSLEKLRKRLGNEKVNLLIKKIHLKEYDFIARELLVNYYDPLYKYSIDKYRYDLILNCDHFHGAIKELELFYKRLEEGSNINDIKSSNGILRMF